MVNTASDKFKTSGKIKTTIVPPKNEKDIMSNALAKYLIHGLGSRLRSRFIFFSSVPEISGVLFLYLKCIINNGITITPIIKKRGINCQNGLGVEGSF